jgi:glycosyltransferase involved in cell wall biosynthesis
MLISIVTPTLNAIQYFEECLQSIQIQVGPNVAVEHIVTDGGSTDGTVELAKSYGARVLTGKDSGIYDAINKGYKNASGDLIGFLGADDVLLPGGLDAVARCYLECDRPDWIVGAGRWIDANGDSLGDITAPPNWISSGMLAALNWTCIQHVSSFVSPALYEKLGGFDLRYKGAADYDMWCRALKFMRYARVREGVACFRRTGENYSMANRDMWEIDDIESKYAPKTAFERLAYRYLMKLWVNAANPDWTTKKFGGRLKSVVSTKVAHNRSN